ncbi:MAG: L-lactate dehydrogenase [Tepidisphaeraceae bacterium]
MSKIAIIGAGAVGSSIAYACMIRGVCPRIALYDVAGTRARAEAMDLAHGRAFVPAVTIEGSDDIAVCGGADVIVITAGAKQKPGQPRLELAAANVAICRDLIPRLLDVAPQAILLLVTNPVDVITYAAMKISGLPRERVFGSGTVLDSARFRYLIAERMKVAVQSVHAYIVGEHGDSEIPLWSTAAIGSVPLEQWDVPGHARLAAGEFAAIFENVRTAAYQVIAGKGVTNYAIGLATAKILEAVLKHENRVLPVSTHLEDWRGIRDVCLSLPCIVGRSGPETPLPIPIRDAELGQLRQSSEAIRGVIRQVGF